MGVAIDPTTQTLLRIVEMKTLNTLQSHQSIELSKHRFVAIRGTNIVASCKDVAGIYTDTEAMVVWYQFKKAGEVLKAVTE